MKYYVSGLLGRSGKRWASVINISIGKECGCVFFPGATTLNGGCILQSSSGL